jgi:putative flavoprotein involved in K+ transport
VIDFGQNDLRHNDFRNNNARSAGATDVIVIGAGHAGLATSYCLNERSIDHVVLERGEVANSWRKERWESLKLLTPNWQSRLPGFSYTGNDPDGFMSMPEVIDFIQSYADLSGAPVRTKTTVTSVRQNDDGYRVISDTGEWQAKSVVIASGACNIASTPKVAESVPAHITTLTPHQYRGPSQLEPGGVLVVGASATGLQLADEIRRAGHDVTIATGEHVRMPRTYRGMDIQFWLDRVGILNERYDEVDDIVRARGLPSPQLVGSTDKMMLDLNRLSDNGVRITGRLMGINNDTAQFSGSVNNVCALADLKMDRMLDTIDKWLRCSGTDAGVGPVERFEKTRVATAPKLTMSLSDGSIKTIIWATGFRPDYSWLDVPVLDRKGRLRHDGGVVDAAGMYVVGLPVLRRRKSSFIHGVEDDVRDLTAHLDSYLHATKPAMVASM